MSENGKIEEQKSKALNTLETMFGFLGLRAELRIEEKGNNLAIKIASEEAGRIIGRKGQTLMSLQLLVNRIMFRGDEEGPRVMLDIDGYGSGNRDGGERPERGERLERRERRDDEEYDGDRRERERRPRRREEEDGNDEEQLAQLALDRAKEVKRWGEPVALAPMNAHDRRIIHVTLQDDAEIETASEGEGALKKVVISLKKQENTI